MSELTVEKGVARNLHRMQQDVAAQRQRMDEEAARFARWQEDWQLRQTAIDAALSTLRQRLTRRAGSPRPAGLAVVRAE